MKLSPVCTVVIAPVRWSVVRICRYLLLIIGFTICGDGLAADESVQGEPSLEAANRLFAIGNHEAAERAFRELLATDLAPPLRGKATFNLGHTLKHLGRYDEAIMVFKSLIGQPVDDLEPGGHLMESYRNYRPRAQWEIGNSLFAKGDFAGARDAYEKSRKKYPFQSWCGNERAYHNYRYAFYDGICLEYLGRPAEAVIAYYQAAFPTSALYFSSDAHFRILNLYEAAGQLPALLSILDEIDGRYFSMIEMMANIHERELNPEEVEAFRPTYVIRRLLELRRLGEEERRDVLMDVVRIQGQDGVPHRDRGNWEVIEAVRLLALTPEESTADLLAALNDPAEAFSHGWMMHALGVCGTQEGLSWLKKRAAREKNIWAAQSLIYSISMGGKRGKHVIDELEKFAEHNLASAINGYRQGRFSTPVTPSPPRNIPKGFRLPESLAELDEEFAYEQSLPESVEIDSSSPKALVKSLLLKTVVREAKNPGGINAPWPSREWNDPMLRFKINAIRYQSDSEAEVDFELGLPNQMEPTTYILKKTAGEWRVSSVFIPGRGTFELPSPQ